MSGLWILILGGFFQIFIGGEITQTAMAVGGAVLFSGKSEIKFLIIILDYIIAQCAQPQNFVKTIFRERVS